MWPLSVRACSALVGADSDSLMTAPLLDAASRFPSGLNARLVTPLLFLASASFLFIAWRKVRAVDIVG